MRRTFSPPEEPLPAAKRARRKLKSATLSAQSDPSHLGKPMIGKPKKSMYEILQEFSEK